MHAIQAKPRPKLKRVSSEQMQDIAVTSAVRALALREIERTLLDTSINIKDRIALALAIAREARGE